MTRALSAVRDCGARCIGTITIDSYTRCGDYVSPWVCLASGEDLNGYPIMSHPVANTRKMLSETVRPDFPIQVRHGTPRPQALFKRLLDLGLNATEGGPVSYCMPYGRVSLREASAAWWDGCRMLATECDDAHLESFGGCLLGQLCPPSLLVAMTVLEGLFFRSAGLRSVSLSYAQGSSVIQDLAALAVLRRHATRMLQGIDWHVVLYTYMGVFPATEAGAALLLHDSVDIARVSGCERMIVKTRAERRQIPTIEENLLAITAADLICESQNILDPVDLIELAELELEIDTEVVALLDSVLNLAGEPAVAIIEAFHRGLLDIPYCLHSDNRQLTRAGINSRGLLYWVETGNLNITCAKRNDRPANMTADSLLRQLQYVSDSYDLRAGARD